MMPIPGFLGQRLFFALLNLGAYFPQARFHFGRNIENYLLGAVEKWADAKACEALVGHAGGRAVENAARNNQLNEWFMNQADGDAKKLFGEYLDFVSGFRW